MKPLRYQLMGDRIVLGESTFCEQPALVCVLAPKEPVNTTALRELVTLANAQLEAQEARKEASSSGVEQ